MEWDKFWSTNKKKYEPTAHRYMGVFKDTCVELHIENAPTGDVVSIPVALHPKACLYHVCCLIVFTCRNSSCCDGEGKRKSSVAKDLSAAYGVCMFLKWSTLLVPT